MPSWFTRDGKKKGWYQKSSANNEGSMDMMKAIMEAHPEIKEELVKAIKESEASSVH